MFILSPKIREERETTAGCSTTSSPQSGSTEWGKPLRMRCSLCSIPSLIPGGRGIRLFLGEFCWIYCLFWFGSVFCSVLKGFCVGLGGFFGCCTTESWRVQFFTFITRWQQRLKSSLDPGVDPFSPFRAFYSFNL